MQPEDWSFLAAFAGLCVLLVAGGLAAFYVLAMRPARREASTQPQQHRAEPETPTALLAARPYRPSDQLRQEYLAALRDPDVVVHVLDAKTTTEFGPWRPLTHHEETEMDPKAAQKRIEDAKKSGDKREEKSAREDLREWKGKGGF